MSSDGSLLRQVSKKDKRWDTHKRENENIGALYGANPIYARYAERMGECADWLEFGEVKGQDIKEHDRKLKLMRASFCHVRWCPICQWRRSLAHMARVQNNLDMYLEANPNLAYIYVVLTVRNCEMSILRRTITEMNKGVNRFLKRIGRITKLHGYVKTVEVTKGKNGLPHPHINLILAFNKSYFTSRDYIPKNKWVILWRESMKLDYDPSVFVRKVKPKRKMQKDGENKPGADLIAGMLEVVKYAVKPSDFDADAEFLYGITSECYKLRFISSGGCLKNIFDDGHRTAEDIDDNDMIHPGGEEEDDKEKVNDWRRIYLWYTSRAAYIMRQRRKVAQDRDQADYEFANDLTALLRDRDGIPSQSLDGANE